MSQDPAILPRDPNEDVTPGERRELAARHYPETHITDNRGLLFRVAEPRCVCGSRWDKGGCVTLRVLVQLAHTERQVKEEQDNNKQMSKALAELGSEGKWRRKDGDLTVTMTIARHALFSGGDRVIDGALLNLFKRFKAERDKLLPGTRR